MLEKARHLMLRCFTYMTGYTTKPYFLDIVQLDMGCFMKFFVVVSTKELVNFCVRPSLLAKAIWRLEFDLENWVLRRVSSIVVEQFGCCAVHPRPKNTDPTMSIIKF